MRANEFTPTKPSGAILTLFLFVVAVSAPAQTYKLKVLHTFHGKDGAFPIGQLTRDAEGNFYSTTAQGGTGNCVGIGCGTVFKLDKAGKLIWSYSFHGKDGFAPYAGVLRDAQGSLYGTTVYGGTVPMNGNPGNGVVFKLDTARKETVLYRFKNCNVNGPHDGAWPRSLLIMDASGKLYGTTSLGGVPFKCQGTAFAMNSTGKETILHRFSGGRDGGGPGSGLIPLVAHTLYGVAGSGGGGAGLAFQMSTSGHETVLYNFTGGSGGSQPFSLLVADSAGNLYGTTLSGGSNCGVNGCGTVFELSPNSSGWTQKTLYVFCQKSQCADGYEPMSGPLVLDKAGNIYGTAYFGGYTNGSSCRGGCGVVFKLDPSGNETVLYSFTRGADGAFPWAGLLMDGNGDLYGTADGGGDLNCTQGVEHGCGVVFELTP